MKAKLYVCTCLLFLCSYAGLSQCLSPINDTANCTGTEPLVVNNEVISVGTTKWFYGTSATFSSLRINGGKLVVCGNLQVNDFGMQEGTLVITRTGRLTVNTGGGMSMIFTGGCSVYNLGFFKILSNLVLDGPGPWTNPVLPNIVWNGPGATFELSNTFFVLEKGNCFFVNKGIANFSGIITNTLADSASVCLGNLSRMNVALLENKRRNTYVAPEGPACVSVSNYGFSYEPLTVWPSVFICKGVSYCVGGCDSIARQNQKWGGASLFSSCNSCANIYLLQSRFTNVRLSPQNNSFMLSWTAETPAQVEFIVQRSADGIFFQSIDTVAMHLTQSREPYYYKDVQPLQGSSFYRVLMVQPANGYTTASSVLSGSLQNDMINISPNPFSNVFTVSIPARMMVHQIRLMDVNGVVVHSQQVGKNTDRVLVQPGVLTAGVYVVQVVAANSVYNVRVVKR
jgi:hypothetical protein